MSKLERRFLSQPITVEGDDKPLIRGYAAVFNSPSEDMGFVEYVDPHAFDDALSGDCRALFNHNADCVLGRTVSGTLRLSVDSKGLAYEIDPPDTQVCRDLMVSMKRGDINQSSFGFYCEKDSWNYDTTPVTRTILKATLLDVSPVTYPAYAASTSEARNFPDGIPESVKEHLTKPEARDADSEEETASVCQCECQPCQDGDCANCSDPDCQCEGCTCMESRSVWALRMKLKLASIL